MFEEGKGLLERIYHSFSGAVEAMIRLLPGNVCGFIKRVVHERERDMSEWRGDPTRAPNCPDVGISFICLLVDVDIAGGVVIQRRGCFFLQHTSCAQFKNAHGFLELKLTL